MQKNGKLAGEFRVSFQFLPHIFTFFPSGILIFNNNNFRGLKVVTNDKWGGREAG